LKLGTVIVGDSLSKRIDFGLKRSKLKVIISNFWHPLYICRTDAVTKFKFCTPTLCTTAVIACGSEIITESGGCHRV